MMLPLAWLLMFLSSPPTLVVLIKVWQHTSMVSYSQLPLLVWAVPLYSSVSFVAALFFLLRRNYHMASSHFFLWGGDYLIIGSLGAAAHILSALALGRASLAVYVLAMMALDPAFTLLLSAVVLRRRLKLTPAIVACLLPVVWAAFVLDDSGVTSTGALPDGSSCSASPSNCIQAPMLYSCVWQSASQQCSSRGDLEWGWAITLVSGSRLLFVLRGLVAQAIIRKRRGKREILRSPTGLVVQLSASRKTHLFAGLNYPEDHHERLDELFDSGALDSDLLGPDVTSTADLHLISDALLLFPVSGIVALLFSDASDLVTGLATQFPQSLIVSAMAVCFLLHSLCEGAIRLNYRAAGFTKMRVVEMTAGLLAARVLFDSSWGPVKLISFYAAIALLYLYYSSRLSAWQRLLMEYRVSDLAKIVNLPPEATKSLSNAIGRLGVAQFSRVLLTTATFAGFNLMPDAMPGVPVPTDDGQRSAAATRGTFKLASTAVASKLLLRKRRGGGKLIKVKTKGAASLEEERKLRYKVGLFDKLYDV